MNNEILNGSKMVSPYMPLRILKQIAYCYSVYSAVNSDAGRSKNTHGGKQNIASPYNNLRFTNNQAYVEIESQFLSEKCFSWSMCLLELKLMWSQQLKNLHHFVHPENWLQIELARIKTDL